MSFNFIVEVTVSSDFGTQEDKICHCFHFFPFYFPGSDGTRCQCLNFLNVEIFFTTTTTVSEANVYFWASLVAQW